MPDAPPRFAPITSGRLQSRVAVIGTPQAVVHRLIPSSPYNAPFAGADKQHRLGAMQRNDGQQQADLARLTDGNREMVRRARDDEAFAARTDRGRCGYCV